MAAVVIVSHCLVRLPAIVWLVGWLLPYGMLSSSVSSPPYILGIDEAGRGPVLGPMVYSYAACPVNAVDELATMGFADSKSINKGQREALLHSLLHSTVLRHHSILLSPQQLSADMQRAARVSLNVISHDAAISLIHHATTEAGLRLAEVYVDTVGDPRSYAAKLQSLFPDIRITVSAKADSLFPIVSAASIVAKCTRDDAIQHWQFTDCKQHSQPNNSNNHISQPLVEAEEEEEEEVVAVSRKRRHTAALPNDGSSEDVQRRNGSLDGTIDRDMGSGYPGGDTTRRTHQQPAMHSLSHSLSHSLVGCCCSLYCPVCCFQILLLSAGWFVTWTLCLVSRLSFASVGRLRDS